MSIEAMKQALNAMERIEDLLSSMDVTHLLVYGEVNEAIITLCAAIKSAEKQEPVAWMVYTLDGKSVLVTDNPTDFTDQHRALPLYTTQPASPVQDPVAWKHDCAALLQNDVELWIDRCPHCGKPSNPSFTQ